MAGSDLFFISKPHSLLILWVVSKCCEKQIPLPSETQLSIVQLVL